MGEFRTPVDVPCLYEPGLRISVTALPVSKQFRASNEAFFGDQASGFVLSGRINTRRFSETICQLEPIELTRRFPVETAVFFR